MRIQRTFTIGLQIAIQQLCESLGLSISEDEVRIIAMRGSITGFIDVRDLINRFEQPVSRIFMEIERAEELIQ